MPADLNNYNLALCYDKLGEAEPAIQYYREFLSKQPNADKRAEIEASVSRLEAALKSASAKRAEEARVAEEARKAEDARRADEVRKAEAARMEEARKAEEAKAPVNDPNAVGGIGAGVTAGVGSTGTPGSGQAISTGDAQLDRVSSIDINSVRDQRMGAGGSGIADNRGGPATAPAGAGAGAGVATQAPPQAGVQASNGQGAPQPQGAPSDQTPKKPTPVYKKWWFWAVVGVGAYVLYSIASEGSNSPNRAREVPAAPPAEGGFTLLRF
jgi:hypothetical protein